MTQVIISDRPAAQAGEHISKVIREHAGDVVCLLAGGSALNVVEHIDPFQHCFHEDCKLAQGDDSDLIKCQKSECRTIFMMGDERGSREPLVNNYLQLTVRYPDHSVTQKTLPTVPAESESIKNFSHRIEETFLQTLTELQNPKIIFLLGVGSDGHTAGIFPMDEVNFRSTYQDDLTYVPVHPEGLRIDPRASFTPTWILINADELIGYVAGEAKREILVDLSKETKKLHERPAELLNLHTRSTLYTDIDLTAE